MSDESNLKTKTKLNKKLLIGAVAVIALALLAALTLLLPKSAEAGKLSESLDLGDKYLSELNYEQAIVSYLEAIEIDPKNVDALVGLADAYLARGEYDKAAEILEDALDELGGDAAETVQDKLEEVRAAKTAAEATPTPEPTNTPTPTPTATPTPVPIDSTEYVSGIFKWRNGGQGNVVITGLATEEILTEISIPNEIEGKPVTEIGDNAFSDMDELTSVSLPETLTIIGMQSFFACYKLSEIVLPEGLVEIRTSAFAYCDSLTSITIPKSVIKIEATAFRACDSLSEIVFESSEKYKFENGVIFDVQENILMCMPNGEGIESYTVPYGTVKIERFAFEYCGFSEISIPDTVREIGNFAFVNCENLKKLVLSKNVEKIGWSFIRESGIEELVIDEDNPVYTCYDGMIFSKDYKTLVNVLESRAGSTFEVPDGTETLEIYLFDYFESLVTVKLPDSVKEIGKGAFRGCESLLSVEIPENVTSIEVNTFSGCDQVVIITPSGSYAEQYAIENGIQVENP